LLLNGSTGLLPSILSVSAYLAPISKPMTNNGEGLVLTPKIMGIEIL